MFSKKRQIHANKNIFLPISCATIAPFSPSIKAIITIRRLRISLAQMCEKH